METVYGSSRIVFLGRRNVFKLPDFPNLKYKKLKIRFFLKYVIGAIKDNIIEKKLSKEYPEYISDVKFSLLGLLNVQKKCQKIVNFYPNTNIINPMGIFEKLQGRFFGLCSLNDELIHVLMMDCNYGINSEGKIVLVDGGHRILENFLRAYGEDFFKIINNSEN